MIVVIDVNNETNHSNHAMEAESDHDCHVSLIVEEKIDLAAARILMKYRLAFEELAK